MAALQGLSDLTRSEIASFLPSKSLDNLASTCRWARICPELAPATRTLADQVMLQIMVEVGKAYLPTASAALGRLLSVRGGGSCKELVIRGEYAIDALLLALPEGNGARLTSLVVVSNNVFSRPIGLDARQLSLVLRLLPGLRRLHLTNIDFFDGMYFMNAPSVPSDPCIDQGENQWDAVWEALGSGVCPCLEELRVGETPGAWLKAFMKALKARQESYIAPLRTLCLADRVPSGLDRLGPAFPANVELRLSLMQSRVTDLAACLRQPAAHPGWLRVLEVRGIEAPESSAMVTALAESGLVRGLRELHLVYMQIKSEALDALSASLSSSRHLPLETLRLWIIKLPDQAGHVSYVNFVTAALSSCSRLKQLTLHDDRDEDTGLLRQMTFGPVESMLESDDPPPFFTPPPSLRTIPPREVMPPPVSLPRSLKTFNSNAPAMLQGVLRAPPGQLSSLQHLDIGPVEHSVRGVMASLAQALPAMTNLRTVKIDAYLHPQDDDEEDGCIGRLADALRAGAARLASLELKWTVGGYAMVLRAMASGACPRLQRLHLQRPYGRDDADTRVLSAEGQWALGGLLKGEPGRSASLTMLDVEEAFVLTDLGLQSMSKALAELTGARIQSLSLSCQPALLPTGPRRLHMVDSLIAALEQPRAGGHLSNLRLHVLTPSGCNERLREEDFQPLVSRLQGALAAGAWPYMPVSRLIGPMVTLRCDGESIDITEEQPRPRGRVKRPAATLQPREADGGAGSDDADQGRGIQGPRDLAALLLPPVLMLAVAWYRLRALGPADK